MLDPALKHDYLEVAWDQKYIKMGMEHMKWQVSNWIGYITVRDKTIQIIFKVELFLK